MRLLRRQLGEKGGALGLELHPLIFALNCRLVVVVAFRVDVERGDFLLAADCPVGLGLRLGVFLGLLAVLFGLLGGGIALGDVGAGEGGVAAGLRAGRAHDLPALETEGRGVAAERVHGVLGCLGGVVGRLPCLVGLLRLLAVFGRAGAIGGEVVLAAHVELALLDLPLPVGDLLHGVGLALLPVGLGVEPARLLGGVLLLAGKARLRRLALVLALDGGLGVGVAFLRRVERGDFAGLGELEVGVLDVALGGLAPVEDLVALLLQPVGLGEFLVELFVRFRRVGGRGGDRLVAQALGELAGGGGGAVHPLAELLDAVDDNLDARDNPVDPGECPHEAAYRSGDRKNAIAKALYGVLYARNRDNGSVAFGFDSDLNLV